MDMNTCKRGCCWTPYSCAKQRTCDHHKDDEAQEQARAAIRSLEADLLRAALKGQRR